jgi:AcrR family transcriptional regulator
MEPVNATQKVGQARGRPGLSREAVVARALEIGTAEGLDAVSLRRLAQELGVTPMALYRHVRDKQDLINAMTEVVLDGIDTTAGLRPDMTWTERMRLAIENYKNQIDERPLALPLSIAYSGGDSIGPRGFWRMLEDLLAILVLAQLSLPRDEFPNLIESAEDTAEIWLSDPHRWWQNTVDLIIFGLERMLERDRVGPPAQ